MTLLFREVRDVAVKGIEDGAHGAIIVVEVDAGKRVTDRTDSSGSDPFAWAGFVQLSHKTAVSMGLRRTDF